MSIKQISDRLSTMLKLDFGYLLKTGSMVGSSHAIGTLLGFGVTLLLANYVDSTTYGQYKYIVAIAGAATAFSLTGAASAVLQSVSRGYDGSWMQELRRSLIWSTPGLILSFGIGGYYIVNSDWHLGAGIALLGIINYAYSIASLHASFLNGKKDFKRLSYNQVLSGTVTLAGVAAVILTNHISVLWLVIAYNGSLLAYQCYAAFNTWRIHTPKNEIDTNEASLSRHLSAGNIVTILSEYVDKIIIFQLLGPYQLAVYAFAVGIPDQVRSVNKLINAIILPRLGEKNSTTLRESVLRHTPTYFGITVVITLLFWFVADWVYQFFFPQYVEAAFFASIYMLILPITAAGMLYGHALQLQRNIASLYSVRIVDAIIKFTLFLILIPLYGILGAVLTLLIAKLVVTVIHIFTYTISTKKGLA